MNVLNVEARRYGDAERAALDVVGSVDYVDVADQDEFRTLLADGAYEAVFVRVGLSVGSDELAAAPGLRFVVTPTTGLDHLDLDALADRGVTLVSLKGHTDLLRSVYATAEHTWALLLALTRLVPVAQADVLVDGRWRREPFLGTELHGRVLGVVGLGRLGRMVARYGLAFGMEVVAHDVDPGLVPEPGVSLVDADELLGSSQVLSLHLPLDDTTRGWLSAERLEQVRAGVFVVNTSRGEIVDEGALIEALDRDRVAGIACDVVADDARWPGTVPVGQPLVDWARTHPRRAVITPHIGGFGRDSVATTRRFVIEQFLALASGTDSGRSPRG